MRAVPQAHFILFVEKILNKGKMNMPLLLGYLAILAVLSLSDAVKLDSTSAIGFISWDMLDHAAAYGGLAMLLMFVFKGIQRQWVLALSVLSTCVFVGILFEYCQLWFTASRQFSYYDAGANVFGALLGVTLFCCYGYVFLQSTKK